MGERRALAARLRPPWFSWVLPDAGITEQSSTAGAIRARLARTARFDRSRSNHLRILSNKTRRTTFVLTVNKRFRQILYEFMNIATREWKEAFMNC